MKQIAIAIAGELSNKLSSKLIENTEQTNEKGDIKKERSTDRQTNCGCRYICVSGHDDRFHQELLSTLHSSQGSINRGVTDSQSTSKNSSESTSDEDFSNC